MEQKPKLPVSKEIWDIIITLVDWKQRLAKEKVPFHFIHLLTTPVKELDGLSINAKNAIYKTIGKKNENNEDTTLLDVVKSPKKDFLKTIGVGKKRAEVIEDFLHSLGLDFISEKAE